ncbi:MAG TPA: hypothetical protein VMU01_03145 [Rhizomicrobium sp.]|nr:hypothetical protein [Rhizomicrobium sp.]
MRHALLAALAAFVLCAATAHSEPAFPDYAVTPLTKADVDLFMGILKAAADHNAHLTGADKEAYDFFMKNKSAPPPPPPNGQPTPQWLQMMEHRSQLLAHAGELATYDVTIAKQRGVQKRYDAIKGEVEAVIDTEVEGMTGECGDSDCGPAPTPAQRARAKAIDAARKADKPLIAPHAAEIRALQKRVNFML